MSYQRSQVLASACAWVLGFAAASALAQSAPEAKTTELEEVVVTGSFIAGTPTDTAMPVEVIGLEELKNMGTPTNVDLVKTMTEVGQVAGETNRYNSFPIGAATINLRNLGSRFSLVLFNGRRMPEQYSIAVGRFNNIAWIPNAPIGRVETLKEGGGVTYGADAVGGVVNYITRKNYEGLEVKADYRYIKDDSGDYTADVLWGKKFGNSDFLLSAGYQHRGSLRSIDRDWARRPYFENDSAFAWSTAGSPGSYIFQVQRSQATGLVTPGTWTSITSVTNNPAIPTVPASIRYAGDYQQSLIGSVRDPNCSAVGGFAAWSATPTPICYFQLAQFEKLVEENDMMNVYAEFNHHFDSGVRYHAEFLAYYQDVPDITAHPSDGPLVYPLVKNSSGQPTATAQATSVGGSYFVPSNNPALIPFLSTIKNADGSPAYGPQLTDFANGNGRAVLSGLTWRLFGNGGNPITGAYDVQHNWTKFYRTTQQLTGDLPEFWGTKLKWDVAVTYDHVIDHKEIHDMLVDRLQDALNGFGGPNCNKALNQPGLNGCQWLNPFSSAIASNYYTGATNPGYVNAFANDPNLIRSLYELMWLERTYEDITVDPVVTGDTGIDLPGGPIAVAFGGQFRYRSEKTQLDDLNNRTINPCPTVGYTGCTTQTGVFAFNRESTVLGAPADILSPFANGRTNRKFPAAAVFIEGQFPILDNLNVSAAGRYEKFFSDITDRDNSVFVPAMSVKWQALDSLALRGSAGKTFSQVNPPASSAPLSPTVATNATYNVAVGGASYSNVDVKPMKGQYFDVGLLMRAGGFTGSLDWYSVKINDFVRTMTTTNVISALVMPGQPAGPTNVINCSSPLLTEIQASLGGRPFVELNGPCVQGSSLLNSNGSGGVGGLLASGLPAGVTPGRINYFGTTDETNSGALRTSGIDLNAAYTFDNVFGGALTPSIDATYVLKYDLGAFVIKGITVTPGFDGVGFRNSSGTRNGQSVPEYRATFGVNYHHGDHNLNIAVRYLPSVIDDNAALFSETTARNANVGGANGVVSSAGTCGVSGYGTDPNGVSTLGATPAGAGTGTNGVSIPAAAGGVTGVTGICTFQNYSILSGQSVKAQTNVDMTYRVTLPAETDIAFTIYNVFDQDPAFSRNAINYDAGFGSPLGRNFKLQIAKRF